MRNTSDPQPRLWSLNFILLVLITLSAFTVRQMAMSSFPLFVTWAGGSRALAGTLTLLLTGASLVIRLFSGPLTDRFGRRAMMLAGAVLYALAMLLIALWPVMGMIAAMQLVFGAGMALLTTASSAAVVDVTPPSRLGEGLGFFTLGNSVAMAIGPGLGIALIGEGGNYRLIYFCAAGLLVLTALLSANVRYQMPLREKSAGFRWRDVLETSTIPAAVLQLLVTFSFSSVVTYITSYAQEVGISGIGSFFTIYALGMILVRLVIGRLIDRRSEKLAAMVSLAVMAAAFLGIVLARSREPLLAAAFVLGLGQGAVMPALQKAAMKRVPPQRRGAGNSTYHIFGDVGTGFGAAAWGLLLEGAGFSAIYLGAAGLCVGGILLAALILDRKSS